MITVYYDGKCGLCSREIAYYRRVSPKGVFDWQDITKSHEALQREGLSLADGLRLLHVKAHDGTMHIGVDGFILMWKQLSYWKLLAAFVALPIIKQLAQALYRLFADWRFSRLSYCPQSEV